VGTDEFWIEVDLSKQTLYAHQGDQLLSSFVVSTGKAGTPTVLGTYQVYVKYKSTDMWGPGYYLPGVPFVMYFYEGYGIHGTYWHNNFGVPTSHGCINLRTDDAAWLYKWVKIGTVVYIHK
jgi:lipoprotein-anchoring transpeptidase ErfK/SrfK